GQPRRCATWFGGESRAVDPQSALWPDPIRVRQRHVDRRGVRPIDEAEFVRRGVVAQVCVRSAVEEGRDASAQPGAARAGEAADAGLDAHPAADPHAMADVFVREAGGEYLGAGDEAVLGTEEVRHIQLALARACPRTSSALRSYGR